MDKQPLPAGSVDEPDYAAAIIKIHAAELRPDMARVVYADAAGLVVPARRLSALVILAPKLVHQQAEWLRAPMANEVIKGMESFDVGKPDAPRPHAQHQGCAFSIASSIVWDWPAEVQRALYSLYYAGHGYRQYSRAA